MRLKIRYYCIPEHNIKNFPLKAPVIFISAVFFICTIFSKMGITRSLLNFISIITEHYIIMVLIWNANLKNKDIYSFFQVSFLLIFIIGCYGLYEKLSSNNPFHSIIMQISPGTSQRNLIFSYENMVRGGIYGRVQSVFHHPITYGAILCMFIVFIITFLSETKNPGKRIIFVLLLLLLLVNLIFVNSRSPILFLIICLTGLLLLSNIKTKAIIFSIGILIIVLIFSFKIFENYKIMLLSALLFWKDEYWYIIGGSSVEYRYLQWLATLHYMKNAPFFGHGLTFSRSMIEEDAHLQGIESILFETLLDTGIIGLIGYIVFFTSILYILLKQRSIQEIAFNKKLYESMILIFIGNIAFALITGELRTFEYLFPFLAIILSIDKDAQVKRERILSFRI